MTLIVANMLGTFQLGVKPGASEDPVQVLALSTGRPLLPVDDALAARVGAQTLGERLQSELFFEALRRTV